MIQSIRLVALAAVVGIAMPLSAFGAGGGDSDSYNNNKKCSNDKVWDKRQKKCVVPKKGALDDDSIYEAGRDLAYAGRYDQAIDVLTLASDRNDKRILNFLGFSHRKAGRLDVGIGYYLQAIEEDPNYTLVREYYGEALLVKGDVDAARAELATIETICGTQTCEAYEGLAEAIAAFENARDG